MQAAHWAMLYERPPLSRDALFFVIAVLLHAPLLYVKIAGGKEAADERMELVHVRWLTEVKPAAKPVPPPPKPKPGIAQAALPPTAASPTPAAPAAAPAPAPKLVGKTFVPRATASRAPAADIRFSGPAQPLSAGTAAPAKVSPALSGKTGFAVARGSLGGIGPAPEGKLAAGPTITLPMAARPSAAPPPAPAVQGKAYAGRSFSPGGSAALAGRMQGPAAAAPAAPAAPHQTAPAFAIAGPLAGRAVLARTLPAMPDWARRQGLEAAVTLRFSVSAAGRVQEDIMVLKTSGYPDIDRSAQEALRRWLFAALAPNSPEEVGTIVMTFRVR